MIDTVVGQMQGFETSVGTPSTLLVPGKNRHMRGMRGSELTAECKAQDDTQSFERASTLGACL